MILNIDFFEGLLGVDKKDVAFTGFLDSIRDKPEIDQSFLGDRI